MPISIELLKKATPAELQEYEKLLTLETALVSPLSYAQYVSSWVERYRYLDLLDRLLVDLIHGRLRHPGSGQIIRKLGVSMPPRHGKSTIISEHTPGWFLTRYPDKRVMLASYEADFAASWGRKVRSHIFDHPEFGVLLDPDSRAAFRWELASPHRGGMFTAGVGGPATGKGADLLIIDDPVKNAEEAQSEIMREKAWEWALSVALTRLEPQGVVVILQTRWHENDLLGRFITQEPNEWFILNLPALAQEDDPLGRTPGEALCPSRYDTPALAEIQSTLGSYWWNALYQGTPSTEGSGIFRRSGFRYWEFQQPLSGGAPTHITLLPSEKDPIPHYVDRKGLSRFMVIDLAASTKTSANWSVLLTCEVTRDRELIVLDRRRLRMEAADHREIILEAYRALKPKWVGVEKATYGLSLITELRRLGVPIRELKPDKDKFSRALPAGALIDAGKVYFPRLAPWLAEFEHELLAFPNGTYDDQVDTLAYAVSTITTGIYSSQTRNPEKEPITLEDRVRANIDKTWKRKKRQRLFGSPGDNPLGRWT